MNKFISILTTTIAAIVGTSASSFDMYAVYDDFYDVGREARYFTAGMVRALIDSDENYCGSDWLYRDVDMSRLNQLDGKSRETDYIALVAGYTMASETGSYIFNSPRDCAKLKASAANWEITKQQPVSVHVGELFRLSYILGNNNCFYDGKLPVESEALWKYINSDRLEYMEAIYDYVRVQEIEELADSEGVSDEFDCAELGAFGLTLEKPDKNFWDPENANIFDPN